MSKKFGKKLSVSRQTLACLDQGRLDELQGGKNGLAITKVMCPTKVWTCQFTCMTDNCHTGAHLC